MKKVVINGTDVPVSGTGVSEEQLDHALASSVLGRWLSSMEKFAATYPVENIEVTAVDYRGRPGPTMVMFVRLRIKAANAPFAQIVELRGDTVVMLPVFRCEGRDYTVLVIQPRIAVGDTALVEVPAGMVDGGTFAGAVAHELEEELGMTFSAEELIELSPETILFSPGLLDEGARFYAVVREMSREELTTLQGKATGLVEEGEKITLHVVPLDELLSHTRDGKALIALALYNAHLAKK